MFFYSRKSSVMLVSIILPLIHVVQGRSVKSIFDGVQRNSLEDLEVSAAEPRPIFMDVVKHPEASPLVNDDIHFSDSPYSASEKIEKILRRPYSFSYLNKDQATSPTKHRTQINTHFGEDQKPSAINYYKYVEDVEKEEKEKANSKDLEEDEIDEQQEDGENAAVKESASDEEVEKDHANKDSSVLEDINEDQSTKGSSDLEDIKEDNSEKESHDDVDVKAIHNSYDHEDIGEDHKAANTETHEDVKEKDHHTKKHGGGGGGGGTF